jgi:hypothetical protein
MKESNSQSKPSAKKRKRISPRKEVAVVTFAAVASIAGVGGLLGVHQPVSQVAQPPPAHVAAASWSSSPHASHSTVSQGSRARVAQPTQNGVPASWSSSSGVPHSTASHTVSQGSKAVARTGQTTNATQTSSRVFESDTQGGEES